MFPDDEQSFNQRSPSLYEDVASHYSKYKIQNSDIKKSTDVQDIKRWKEKVENRKANKRNLDISANDMSMVSESMLDQPPIVEGSENLNASTKYPGIASSYAPPTKLSSNFKSHIADQGNNTPQNEVNVSQSASSMIPAQQLRLSFGMNEGYGLSTF